MLAHSRAPRNPAGFLATASESIKEVDSGKTDLWHGCHKIGEESSKIVPLGAPCSSILQSFNPSIPQSHSIQNLLRPFFPSAFTPAICFFRQMGRHGGIKLFFSPPRSCRDGYGPDPKLRFGRTSALRRNLVSLLIVE